MSVFDVHINRSPIAGTIRKIAYIPGAFLNADLDKASEDNERQHFLVERSDGSLIGFTGLLIAVPAAACIGVLGRFGIRNYRDSKLYLGSETDTEGE